MKRKERGHRDMIKEERLIWQGRRREGGVKKGGG
jgi:hypothetical protein